MQNAELAFVSASRALRELPDEEASLTLAVTLSERASQRRRGAGRAAGGDPPPGLGGRRPGGHPPRAGQGTGGARAARRRPSTPGGGCWRSCRPTASPWACWSGSTRRRAGPPSCWRSTGDSSRSARSRRSAPRCSSRSPGSRTAPSTTPSAPWPRSGGSSSSSRTTPRPWRGSTLLCQKQERWPELADVIGRRLALPGGDLDFDLRTRLAVVRETRLLDKYRRPRAVRPGARRPAEAPRARWHSSRPGPSASPRTSR